MTKLTAPDSEPSNEEVLNAFSRRTFLYSLGALALSGCGVGSSSGPDTQEPRMLASVAGTFAHPGLLHTEADFQRMRDNLASNPWQSTWNLLTANGHSSLDYTPRPVETVYRGDDGVHAQNYSLLFNDVAAAYQCALRWKISGDENYAKKSIEIMNAWSQLLTGIGGSTDAALCAGIQGYEFANAGEIMRTYSGWAAADFKRFQDMMVNVFYKINTDFLVRHNGTEITHYWANWDLCQMASILAIGVLCDDQALFDEAVNYFKGGWGNGSSQQAVYYLHPGYLGQWQESGRDQGHNTLGIALMGAFCEMAWNQNVDLYGYDNNRFLAGAEYVAKANLIDSGTTYYTVPYVTYTNVDKVNQTVLSTSGIGLGRPTWALVYHHYANRKGIAAPYSKKFMDLVSPENGGTGSTSGGYDQLGFTSLTCTRLPIANGAPPSGLTGYLNAGGVMLSWWGSVYATSYTVKRASTAGGPYSVVQSGITDLLTFTDTTRTGGTWYYVVTASTPGGESAPSNEVAVVTGTALHTWLKCDEISGTVASDASGMNHPGTLVGGGSWVAGRKGNALALNGSTGYLSLPNDLMLKVGDFTISTWVYWDASKNWTRIFDFGSGTGHYMFLTPRSGAGTARFAMTVNGGYGELQVNGTAALPVGQWTHVAVTLSGRTCILYVNGAEVARNTYMFEAPFRLGSTSQNWIGRSQYNDPYFNGKVDDFRIYHGALSASDIATLASGA
jgi:hypothetical protein